MTRIDQYTLDLSDGGPRTVALDSKTGKPLGTDGLLVLAESEAHVLIAALTYMDAHSTANTSSSRDLIARVRVFIERQWPKVKHDVPAL
jgi:hypothetical protein